MERVNRLKDATSPYLLRHVDNPVDRWEWEPAAFEEASAATYRSCSPSGTPLAAGATWSWFA